MIQTIRYTKHMRIRYVYVDTHQHIHTYLQQSSRYQTNQQNL